MSVEVKSERLRTVFRIVESLLTDPCHNPLPEIGFSQEHVNRLLHSFIGEPLKPFSLRLRLERAAIRLQDGASVNDVAEEAGYATIESFIKAFGARFGVSPGRVRTRERSTWTLTAPSSIHWSCSAPITLDLGRGLFAWRRPSSKFAARPFVGDYRSIPEEWRRLCSELPEKLTSDPKFVAATIFHDDGMRTEGRDVMRAHLGFSLSDFPIPHGYEVVAVEGGIFLASEETASASEHSRKWGELNSDWVCKARNRKPKQPGLDEYSIPPYNWASVKARPSLAIPISL